MARFPKKEAKVVALAERLWQRLWSNRPIYPTPPVHPILIRIKSMIYSARREYLITKQAAAEEATTAKDEALEDLADAMKSDIRYAENTVDFDDDKLKLIGWVGRKAKTLLAPPGQVRLLEAPKQGKGWVRLSAVKIDRRGRSLSISNLTQKGRKSMTNTGNSIANEHSAGNEIQEDAPVYEDEINLMDYFLVLWKHKWLILVCSVLPALIVGLECEDNCRVEW